MTRELSSDIMRNQIKVEKAITARFSLNLDFPYYHNNYFKQFEGKECWWPRDGAVYVLKLV